MWLATIISVLFFADAAWRIARPGSDTFDKASAYFNAANFFALGLLGLGCLYWPRRKKEDDKSPAGAEQVVVVVDSAPATESATDAPAAEAPPKRQLTYLSNLKTFLTFIVVTFHVVYQLLPLFLAPYDITQQPPVRSPRSFALPGALFLNLNQYYFMAPFFLISAYFCPGSLDRKGFRKFVLDKLVRLGGALVLWTLVLSPLMTLMILGWTDQPLSYLWIPYTTWFVLWLLNFSVAYAVIAQFTPTVKMSMPHPFFLLVLGVGLSGVFYGIMCASEGREEWRGLGSMVGWQNGISMYIPWFIAGIVGSRNDWLMSVEEMPMWVVWTLRLIVVGFWTIMFMMVAQYFIPIPGSHLDIHFLVYFLPPVYAMPMTLVVMQLFHQYFNATPQSKLMRNMGSAAYLVYVIHLWPLDLLMFTFVEILKAAGTPIIFVQGHFMVSTGDGGIDYLSDGAIWGGFFFMLVLTQLIVWPLSFYLRKLPVMNKMF